MSTPDIDWNDPESICKAAEPGLYRMVSADPSFWKAALKKKSVQQWMTKHKPKSPDPLPVVYLARWSDTIGAGGFCIFSALEPAIFFVVSGLIHDVDWGTFPDRTTLFPNEERNGNEKLTLTPVFRVNRLSTYDPTRRVYGEVLRMEVANQWAVGNGAAEASKQAFLHATGRDSVELSGTGDKFMGRVGTPASEVDVASVLYGALKSITETTPAYSIHGYGEAVDAIKLYEETKGGAR